MNTCGNIKNLIEKNDMTKDNHPSLSILTEILTSLCTDGKAVFNV